MLVGWTLCIMKDRLMIRGKLVNVVNVRETMVIYIARLAKGIPTIRAVAYF